MSLGETPSLDTTSFTFEIWFNWKGGGVPSAIDASGIQDGIPLISLGGAGGNISYPGTNYFLGIQASTGKLAANFKDETTAGDPASQDHPVLGRTRITTGVWHHAAGTFDGLTWNLYLDGNLDASLALPSPTTPRSGSSQRAFLAAAITAAGAPDGFFQGTLDEARIWDTARTGAEIQSAINQEVGPDPRLIGRWGLDEGTGAAVADSSGHGVTGTTVQGPAWVAGAPFDLSPQPSAGQPETTLRTGPEANLLATTSAPDAPGLTSPADGATGVSTSPTLNVTVSDPDSTNLTVTFYGRPTPGTAAPDFTLVALPDTQKYTALKNGIFELQTQWIVDHRASRNIAFVTHLGDLVDDWSTPSQWNVANLAITKLDSNGIPYGLGIGNCDENGFGSNPAGPDLFNNYFPASRYQGRSYYGGAYNGDNHNSYQLFSASGLNFIILHLQYYNPTPDPAIITWASNVLQTYSNRRAILVTHFLLDTSNVFSPQAAAIYQAVKDKPNLFLMLGGHLDTEGRRQDPGTDGHPINSLRADFQTQSNGGNGWLRIMRFSPGENKIYVQTYSPYLDQYLTDAQSQFVLDYPMGGISYQVLGTKTNVAPGSSVSLSWPNLNPLTAYQWYVTVSDGTSTTTGPTWSFTTGAPDAAPVVTTQPAGQTVTAGQTASFTAAASGSPIPTAQWQVSTDNGTTWTSISGATSPTYSFTAQAADNGKLYRAVFTNTAGSATSSAVGLTVNAAPAISSPDHAVFVAGASSSFTLTATGLPTPALSQGGTLPGGVTFADNGDGSATLAGTPAAGSGGVYNLIFTATNSVSSATQSFTLTVNQVPAITIQPTNQTINAGQTVSFTAAASGYPTPSPQWQVSTNGGATWTNISGATSSIYSFTAQSSQNGDQYRATFSNAAGSATTNAAALSVNGAPAITTQPANQVVTAGQSASFAAAASGNPQPAVQWQVSTDGGTTWNDIPGATTATYTFTAQASDNGKQYRAVFTNIAGSATSNAAVLTVNTVPAITSPNNALFVAGTPGLYSITTTGFPVPAISQSGTLPGGITFADNGNGSATLGGTPSAGTGGAYNLTFTAANIAGSASQSFTLTVNQAPAITTQPANQTVNAGQTVSFTAVASGYPAPSVQWQVSTDGVTWTNISDATSTTYTFTAQSSQSGNGYWAVFTNAAGTVTSNAASLSINGAPVVTTQPANQAVTADQSVTFTAAASGNPQPTVQWQVSTDGGGAWNNISGAISASYIFTVQASDNGKQYRAVFTNVAGSATSNAALLTVNTAPAITSPDHAVFVAGASGSFTLTATGLPTPALRQNGVLPGGVNFTDNGDGSATLAGTPAAETGGVYNLTFTATNSASSATQSFTLTVNQAPVIAVQPANQTVNAGQSVSFTAAASGYPTPSAQWQVSMDGGTSWADISGATSTIYTFTAQSSQNGSGYRAVFTNAAGTAATNVAILSMTAAPVVTAQPANQAVTAGQTASFSAAASGSPQPAVQWQVSRDGGTTWNDIPGATAPTYTFTAQASDNGKQYRAVFTNTAGSADSSAAVLTVNTSPAITSANNAQFTVGIPGSFTVVATGLPAPSISTSGTLPTGVQFNAATGILSGTPSAGTGGVYNLTFTATNSAGSASQSFTLMVDQAPAITTQPADQSAYAGQTVMFSAAASGYPTPTVQWQLSMDSGATWTDIPGATATSYSFTLQTADSGKQYRAVFTNLAGSVTSSAAVVLTMNDLIFTDDFSSCSASAWLGPNSAVSPSFSTSAGRSGCGMSGAIGASPVFVADPSPNSETTYKARFYFNPNTIKLSKGDTLNIFGAYKSGSSTPLLVVQLHSNNGKSLVLRVGATSNNGAWSYTGWVNLTSGWRAIEVDWQASGSPTANNGSLNFLQNGSQVASLANLGNDQLRVDTVSMGIISGMTQTTTGAGYFDDFVSRRYNSIGAAQIPAGLVTQYLPVITVP